MTEESLNHVELVSSDSAEFVANAQQNVQNFDVKVGQQKTCIFDQKTSKFLFDCRPEPYVECYVHLIDIQTEYVEPEVSRKNYCRKLLSKSKYAYGIVTRKRIPKIPKFPLFLDFGRVRVHICCNFRSIIFTKSQIRNLIKFHKFLFLDVLRKVKTFSTFDEKSEVNSYLIAPLEKSECGEFDVAWSVINHKSYLQLTPPTLLGRVSKDYSKENYLGAVVKPWYRDEDISLFYIVTEVDTGVYLDSKMYQGGETFHDYFKNRHKLEASSCSKELPLLEVQTFNIREESIKPRFQCLLLAEELRLTIVKKAGIGKKIQIIDPTEEIDYFLEEIKSVAKKSNFSKSRELLKLEKHAITGEAQSNMETGSSNENNRIEETSERKIHFLTELLGQLLFPPSSNLNMVSNSDCETWKMNDIPPPLLTLQDHVATDGPNMFDILQAITLKSADDTICLERLETMGDSCLKFSVSFFLFVFESNLKEGQLTKKKNVIVGNNNLFLCGKQQGIPSFIQTVTFSVDDGWMAPSFSVPATASHLVSQSGEPATLLHISIPYVEQFSGHITEETIAAIKESVYKTVKITKPQKTNALFYLGKCEISSKSVADVVEALIATYLWKCGLRGSFALLNYLNIIPLNSYAELMSHKMPPSPVEEVKLLIPCYQKIEHILDYEFNDKALLLQAVTPRGCSTNTLTDCYQRLEFMGDAVLDFLITSFIYQYCGKLSPGQITELRSALVSNNMFGALVVKFGLHKYALDSSSDEVKADIARFVSYQEKNHHRIHGNLFLIYANDIAEEISVPKQLADLFESIAGAIFIDSGYNLSLVWEVFYKLMNEELVKFTLHVPINPVRAVNELNFEKKTTKFKDNIKLCLKTPLGSKVFLGCGKNLRSAERAVCKHALNCLGYPEFVF